MGASPETRTGEVLEAEYEPGRPAEPLRWRRGLRDRKAMLRYLATAERYWYGEEGYGSERRKTRA